LAEGKVGAVCPTKTEMRKKKKVAGGRTTCVHVRAAKASPELLGNIFQIASCGGAHSKVFNFVIAKISVTTEITEFRKIRPKFRRNFVETST
jgi:hypothetical protein